MNEQTEQLCGQEAVERAAGYAPLFDPQAETSLETFGSDASELRRAASETVQRRLHTEQQPIERRYNGEDGHPLPEWNSRKQTRHIWRKSRDCFSP